MNLIKKFSATATALLMISAMSVGSFAATYNTPAEIAASLTGRTVEDVLAERYETGKTFGTIANEAGRLDEFKEESLLMKSDILDQQVDAGYLSREEADSILEAIQAQQAICDGTGIGAGAGIGIGSSGVGAGTGAGAGFGGGYCGGLGLGQGRGFGGGGRGMGRWSR